MTKQTTVPPRAPKLPARLEAWHGSPATVLELQGCAVEAGDFSAVKKLDVEGCTLTAVMFAGGVLDKLHCSDALLSRVEAAGLRAFDAALLRSAFKNSRLTGADFGAALVEDCTFDAVKLDEAGWRFATFKRVAFQDCVLRQADFTGATFSHASFVNCDLDGANFDRASCSTVNLRGEKLAAITGINGLRGVRITSEQMIELAPLMALELGLDVDDET